MRLRGAAAVGLVLAVTAGGCGSAAPAPEAAPPDATREASPTRAPARTPAPRAPERPSDPAAAVAAALAGQLPAGAGAAVAPLDGGRVRLVGAAVPTPAWSTIKVPVAATVLRERRAGRLPGGTQVTPAERDAIVRAIVASDNAAADLLYSELVERFGGHDAATARIDATLRRAGDSTTRVNASFSRPGFSNVGQTRWPLARLAGFYRAIAVGDLVAPADRELILGSMEAVDSLQRWGAWAAPWPSGRRALVKGGWGPSEQGGYDVVQAAIVPGSGGLALAWAVVAPSFEAGQAQLTDIARTAARAARRDR